MMYLFGVIVIISILLDMVLLLLKYKINKNREIKNANELEIECIVKDEKVNCKEASYFWYNFCTRELGKKAIVSYTDYIKLLHEYCHAIHNEVTGYKICKYFAPLILFGIVSVLVLIAITFIMNKVILVLALICLFLYLIYYLFVMYIEISANAILLKKENIKRDKLVVAFIVLNMLNEFVFRILGFVVLYSFLIKAWSYQGI